jgi:RsiW-degrading membrane proteinase PrsW (M82 family)
MSVGILLVGAVLPVALIMLWVYCRDRLREPRRVVLITMALGGVIAIPVLLVQFPVSIMLGLEFDMVPATVAQALGLAFIVAALVEEGFKFGVLRFYSARHDAFDEPFDGIVYGVAASLGFALVENVLYVAGSMMEGGFVGGLTVAIARAILAVPLHASCGVIMGACIGLGHFGRGAWWSVLGVVLAVVVHGTYDTFIFATEVPTVAANGTLSAVLLLGVPVTALLGVAVAGVVIARFRRQQLLAVAVSSSTPVAAIGIPRAVSVVPQGSGIAAALPAGPSPASSGASLGIPRLPAITLGLSVLATGLPILGLLIGVVTVTAGGELSDAAGLVIGLSFILGAIVACGVFPLSIVSICLQPRWRAGSILSLVLSVSMLIIAPLLVLAAE